MTKEKLKKNKNKKFASVRYHLHLPTDLHDADFENNMRMSLGRGGWIHSTNPIGKDVI